MCLKQGLQKRRVSKQNKQSGARGPGLDSVASPSRPPPVPGDYSRRHGAPAHPKKNIPAPASPWSTPFPLFSFFFLRIEYQKVYPRGRKSAYLKRLTDTGEPSELCVQLKSEPSYFPVPFISQVMRHLCLNPEPLSVNNNYWVSRMGWNFLR